MARLFALLTLVIVIIFGIWFFFMRSNVQKVKKEGPIIFFGNSITAGVGAGEGEDFPTLVAKELNLKNTINAGVSGDTTAGGLARLKTDVLDKNPSLVIVELSGNDFLAQVSANETIKNLDSIIKQIHESGAAVLMIHIKFPLKESEYENGFKTIAQKYKAEVLWNAEEGIADNPSLMADDVHPNAAGYKILASRIAKAIKSLL
jgi:lysophospholipase L1-like esterase